MNVRNVLIACAILVLAALFGLPLDDVGKPLLFGLVLATALTVMVGATELAKKLAVYALALAAAISIWGGFAAQVQSAASLLRANVERALFGAPGAAGLESGGPLQWVLVTLGVIVACAIAGTAFVRFVDRRRRLSTWRHAPRTSLKHRVDDE